LTESRHQGMEHEFIAKIKRYVEKHHRWLKNKYLVTTGVFVLWMILIDSNNVYIQISRVFQIKDLNKDIAYYEREIVLTNKEKKALFQNGEYLEKFVRERYWMKRDDEEVFIFSDK